MTQLRGWKITDMSENLLMGVGKQGNRVYVTDLGLVKERLNHHKNAVALKEMKTNEEPLSGVGQAYISFDHDTCLLL